MPTYRVEISKKVYVYETWVVDAEDEEAAVELYDTGKCIEGRRKLGTFDVDNVKELE